MTIISHIEIKKVSTLSVEGGGAQGKHQGKGTVLS